METRDTTTGPGAVNSPQIAEDRESLIDDDFNQQLPIDQSKSFIGKWNRLISTTNWEKGSIIVRWRHSLIDAGASQLQYSDEAWSRMVGDVTAQHVGRLRRTSEKYHDSYQKYDGLYWSHFYASLDWEDAEMWLEGAVQNRWSVSNMRRQRWETLGKIPEQEPRVADVVVSEIDEGFQPLQFEQQVKQSDRPGLTGPRFDEPDFGDEPAAAQLADERNYVETLRDDRPASKEADAERVFENLGELPEDLADAVEAMKIAIIRHKLDGWQEISRNDVNQLLDALKKLTRNADGDESA